MEKIGHGFEALSCATEEEAEDEIKEDEGRFATIPMSGISTCVVEVVFGSNDELEAGGYVCKPIDVAVEEAVTVPDRLEVVFALELVVGFGFGVGLGVGVGLTLAAAAWMMEAPRVGSGTSPLTSQPRVGIGHAGGLLLGV